MIVIDVEMKGLFDEQDCLACCPMRRLFPAQVAAGVLRGAAHGWLDLCGAAAAATVGDRREVPDRRRGRVEVPGDQRVWTYDADATMQPLGRVL